MKKLVLTLAFFTLGVMTFNEAKAQITATEIVNGPQITFDKEVHDYGTIEQGGDGSCVFTFTNTGTEPLTITTAKGSCGCTVPEWPREPIAPGKTGTIKVKYDSKRVGPINKSVTINSNAVNEPTKVIRIKGNVAAGATAPLNISNDGPIAK